MEGWLGLVSLSWFLLQILESMCCGIGLFLWLMFPRGMNSLSAWMIVSVMKEVSWWMLSEGVWERSLLSIQLVKSVQSAFLKLMKVLRLWFLVCLWSMKVVVRIGRWSEGSCFRVVQLALIVRWEGRIVRSGEVLCCLCR